MGFSCKTCWSMFQAFFVSWIMNLQASRNIMNLHAISFVLVYILHDHDEIITSKTETEWLVVGKEKTNTRITWPSYITFKKKKLFWFWLEYDASVQIDGLDIDTGRVLFCWLVLKVSFD